MVFEQEVGAPRWQAACAALRDELQAATAESAVAKAATVAAEERGQTRLRAVVDRFSAANSQNPHPKIRIKYTGKLRISIEKCFKDFL